MTAYPENIQRLLQEIRTTRFNVISGHGGQNKKIYKMVLLLAMLEGKDRNLNNWWWPITPGEAAPFFHFMLTHWESIRDIQFGEEEKRKYRICFDEASRRFTENLIAEMPMAHWGKGDGFAHYDKTTRRFHFRIEIDPDIRADVHRDARAIAVSRIRGAMPGLQLPDDFWDFQIEHEVAKIEAVEAEKINIPETERNMIIRGRIGQGKFRTHLLQKYNQCVLCQWTHPKLLIASHIKRWVDSSHDERLDLNNALLLCPLHDRLFDSWMISFNEKGDCIINRHFHAHPDYRLLTRPLRAQINLEPHQPFLEHHRGKLQEAERNLSGYESRTFHEFREPSTAYCPFCDTGDRILLFQNSHAKAFMDGYPVSPGHILVVPHRHFSSWFDANAEEREAFDALLMECRIWLKREYGPEDFNIGVNVGKAAGQSVGHMHIHLIPRYPGDMADPKGGVRGVIPEKQKY